MTRVEDIASRSKEETGELPKVSVIIPVWNGEGTIGKCLASVLAQSYPKDLLEIIVVDNGSTDRTREIVAAFSTVVLLSEPEASSYRARNLGLSVASGEYVAFTDADCVPWPNWIAEGVGTASAASDVGIVAGAIELELRHPPKRNGCEVYDEFFSGFDQARNASAGHCVTANWISARRLLQEFGGFDNRLKSAGDVLLSRKIAGAGYQIVFCPGMIVQHSARSDLRSQVARRRRIIGGRWTRERGRRTTLAWVGVVTREFAGEIYRFIRSKSVSPKEKISAICVATALFVVSLWELARLTTGSVPSRA